jgi:hypothetical protein
MFCSYVTICVIISNNYDNKGKQQGSFYEMEVTNPPLYFTASIQLLIMGGCALMNQSCNGKDAYTV